MRNARDSDSHETGETPKAPAPSEGETGPIRDLEVCITAEEAYPQLERAFLNAQDEILCSFRVFDFCTKLRSDEAREIGETWFDLVIHTLDRGVSIRLVVSDFDPVAAPEMHQNTWRTCRQVAAVRELSRDDAPGLVFIPALHDAAVGPFPRVLFGPLVRQKLRELRMLWKDMTDPQRDRFRRETPRLRDIILPTRDGQLETHPARVTLIPATHHQKIAVFDRNYLSIGGLDLNERRYDTKDHERSAERTWQDVQVFVRGPIAESAARHIETFLDTVAKEAPAAPPAEGFLRTISRVRLRNLWWVAPKTVVEELRQQHLDEIGRAERLIYLETQFLRHLPIARALARRARDCPDLRLFIVLPAAPETVAFSGNYGLDARYGEHLQVRSLEILRRAFGRDRLLVASPVQPRRDEDRHEGRATLRDAPLIYVHSKVSIFDDTSAIVSSANLNGRSMRWDTEAGLLLTRPDQVDHFRRRILFNWLPKDVPDREEYLDVTRGFEKWLRLVNDNSAAPPENRHGFLVRYDSDAAREMAAPLPGIPEESV
ncbi:phospholipase [Roseovarius sp. SCSIO 43702]|uniref:phospholipase D family protein n=1 Tax=Roseovarius sp. SCSIO 43702 TaxID=2823043 RepID=UPI001C730E83|nr:phospholipase D-like domain-containing protein [Roseovarius sp. SCSIO 43702]QYX57796.1 phospholipase [Roseovarius sp. SCSIO 43702]